MSIISPGLFFTPFTISYAGTCTSVDVPWVQNFDTASKSPAVVLTQRFGVFDPGLYAKIGDQTWSFAMPYKDLCAFTFESSTFSLMIRVNSQHSFPEGSVVYRNGKESAGTSVDPDVSTVYAVATPMVGRTGGSASFSYAGLPTDLPTPTPSDPKVLLNDGTGSSSLHFAELRSVGGQSLGLSLIKVN